MCIFSRKKCNEQLQAMRSWAACLKDLVLVYSPTLFSNQHATGWVTRKMASSQRQQMASVSAVEEWVGGPFPN